jgi:prepilin-type N-terminal cleavage/methylation domain-containing protein
LNHYARITIEPHGRAKESDPRRLSLQDFSGIITSPVGNIRGVTLLEVMVALGIAALVLVAVYRLQIQSIAMETTAQFHTVAPLLAEQLIARAELQTPDFPATDSGRFEEDGFENYAWEITTQDAGSFATPTGQQLLKQIDVRIFHHDKKDQFSMRTYRLAVPTP